MNRKLKIAVFHNLPAGGAIKALQDNLNFLKKDGHYVDIYTTDTSNNSFLSLKEFCDNYYVFHIKRSKFRKNILKLIEKLIPSYKFEDISRVAINYGDFKNTQKKIAEEIDNGGYDFVLIEQDFLFSLTPDITKYIKTLKIYYCDQTSRSSEEILKKLNPVKLPFYLKFYSKLINDKYLKLDIENAQNVDYILCNSYFTHENILKIYGMNSSVSYLGINTKQFHAQKISRENVVLSVGSITPTKGFDFLIKSIAKVDINIRPKFLIVGYLSDVNWTNYLKSLARDLNVELEILSGISYDELIKIYNEVKLVLFAPYLEPFGLVPLEAAACGTPVIGVKEGGVKETVKHGKTGLLVERDEYMFAEGIVEMLTNYDLWNKCSDYSPKYV